MRRLLLLLLLAGCGSDRDDRPATWEYIHAAILIPNCATSGCHAALTRTGPPTNPPSPLNMHDSKKACLYIAGLHDTIVTILEKGGNFGGYTDYRMPPDQPLPQADINLIAPWVDDGSPCPP